MNKKITRRDFLETMGLMGVSATALAMGLTACSGGGAAATDLEEVWNAYVASKGETSGYFLPGDYDGNGVTEAYAISGRFDEWGYTGKAKIYFISSTGKVTCVKDEAYGGGSLFGQLRNSERLEQDPESVFLKVGKQRFIIWEIDGGGSSSVSVILGVKNGSSYQPSVSGKYQWFHKDESKQCFVGTKSDFSQGYHEYIDHSFRFNDATGEFEEIKK